MIVASPIAGVQAGQAAGGGLLTSISSALTGSGGVGPSASAPPPGDGSVGLFDGVLSKALISGGIGAAVGLLPFIPGGPLIGGVLGALGGAAMQVFGNWRTMQTIRQENQAMLAAVGVQVNDPQVQQVLQTGNVQQLIPLVQQQSSRTAAPSSQGPSAPAAERVATVYDPVTGTSQLVNLDTGRVVTAAS